MSKGQPRGARQWRSSRQVVIVSPGAFAIPSEKSSSVEQVIQKTAEPLAAHVPVTVIGRKTSFQRAKEVRGGVTYVRVPFMGPGTYIAGAMREIAGIKPAVIQVDNRPRYVWRLRRKFPHATISLVLHSTYFISEPHIALSRLRACLRAATTIIVNSEFLKAYLQKKVPAAAHKIVVNYLGVDTGSFISKWSPEGEAARRMMLRERGFEGRKIILYAGRLIPQKGVHHLLEAMPAIIQREPRALLVIVGSAFYGSRRVTPYVARLKKRARALAGHVVFVPYVKHQDIPAWMRLAEVAVVPSIGKEAFGLVNVEAMASGVPVVATRAGGIQEVVEDGQTGVLVSIPKIRRELAASLLRVLQDDDLQRKLGEQGIARVQEKFTWQRSAEKRLELYARWLENARSGG
ncbi:glycosyltransferase family 4 protein [Paenibacillus whitsoniae]|uniref:glycosyltransferase family 4 protein n=1 Tax=Paenibacillus whitsoniae TaxID=2496558 RepID=UPI001F495008|nr:glycosyltransferase family 4 protein [Paenibacillus whitsoniae]